MRLVLFLGNQLPIHNTMMGALPHQHQHQVRQMIPLHLQNGHQSLNQTSLPHNVIPSQQPGSLQMGSLPQHLQNTQHLPQQHPQQQQQSQSQSHQQLPQQPQHSNSPLHGVPNHGSPQIQVMPGMHTNQPMMHNAQQQSQANPVPQSAPTNQSNFAAYPDSNSMVTGNYQHPAVSSQIPQLNHQSHNNPSMSAPQFLPNTVMTTQIQPGPGQQMPPASQLPNANPINTSPRHHNIAMMPNQIAAINQPVTSTILPQSDSRKNIPIYQQQR